MVWKSVSESLKHIQSFRVSPAEHCKAHLISTLEMLIGGHLECRGLWNQDNETELIFFILLEIEESRCLAQGTDLESRI
jgi:hypothetical protein